MKKAVSAVIIATVLCGSAAFAADLPRKAPVYKAPPLPAWSWTGFYLGAYAGVGINRSRASDPVGGIPGNLEYLGTGFTGGLTAGYNWQFDPHWVVGVEGDIGYLGLSHEFVDYFQGFTTNSKTSWLGTLRGRLGYTSGPTLTYVTGGAAFAHFDDSVSLSTSAESAKTKAGYAVGSGVETRLGGNWTFKSESLYVDVGAGDLLLFTGGPPRLEVDKHRYLVQRFGVNYLFGDKPAGPLPQQNWQGFFVGAVAGTAAAQTHVSSANPATAVGEFGDTGTGFTGGIIAGYNWQFAPRWVAGIEGDFSWLGIDHTVDAYNIVPGLGSYNLDTRWLATARARLGYSTGPALLYVTGGGAWVNYEETWTSPATITTSSTKTLGGYAVGGGVETSFSLFGLLGSNWMTRSEYLYVNVGDGDTLTAGGFPVVANHQFHLFRSALVYRFGG
jgi:outer membrane immunogenic protein